MKKRVLSLFMAFVLCLTLLPAPALAVADTADAQNAGAVETAPQSADAAVNSTYANGKDTAVQNGIAVLNGEPVDPVAMVGNDKYETLQEALDEANEGEITLLGNVAEGTLIVSVATTIHMAGFTIDGDIKVEAGDLTLNNGTVKGTVTVNNGIFIMAASAGAEAAIDGGLNVGSGSSCIVCGAAIGVKGTLSFEGSSMTIRGTEKAVAQEEETLDARNMDLYGSTKESGGVLGYVSFQDGTYWIVDVPVKKLTNYPYPTSLKLTPESMEVTAGQITKFTADYDGVDKLTAYVQNEDGEGKGKDNFTITQTKNEDGTYTISVKVYAETPSGKYTLFVQEANDSTVQAQATISVTALEPVAEVNEQKYKLLTNALEAAQNGDTVKLLADHTTDWNAVNNETAPDYSTLAVVKKTLTLDLNGCTVDYLMVGEPTYGEEKEDETVDVAITSGDLTVIQDGLGVLGSITDLWFISGKLNIQNGTIGKLLSGGSPAGGINCVARSEAENITSETEYGGEITIAGGKVYGLTVREDTTVTVSGGSDHAGTWINSGGTLNITDGMFGNVGFRNDAGTIAIRGGMFGMITNYDASKRISVMPLLADGYAFYDSSDTVQDGSKDEALTNVTVKSHAHELGEDGTSCACGAALVASVTAKDGTVSGYYDTLGEAFQKAGWDSTVTLLTNVELSAPLAIVSGEFNNWANNFTLDLNGKTISCAGTDTTTVFTSATLTICDNSNGKTGEIKQNNNFYALQSGQGGKLTITGGKFGPVGIFGDGEIRGGTFSKIWAFDYTGSPVKLHTLLVSGYAFQYNNGKLVNGYEATNADNVTVVEHTHEYGTDGACACGLSCGHPYGMDSATGACKDCGMSMAVAKVEKGDETTYYDDIHAAFDAAKVSNGGTLTLLQDVTLKNDDSIYLYPENGEQNFVFTVDWKGHTLSGNYYSNLLTLSGRTSVTLKDSKGENAGGVRNDGSGAAMCLSLDGYEHTVTIQGGTYSPRVYKSNYCTGVIKISGGVFRPAADAALTVDMDGKLADWLAEGFTLAYDEAGTSLLNVYSTAYTEAGKIVYVVEHKSHTYTTNGACACGAPCPHDVDESGYCAGCKQTFAARIGNAYYATVTEALSAVQSGKTVTLLANVTESIAVSNSNNIFYLDLNGKTINTLTVSGSDTPKLMDNAEKKGLIHTISYSNGILASLLRGGWGFKSGDAWLGADALFGASAKDVSVAKASITGVGAGGGTVSYGETATVTAEARPENLTDLSYQWYKLNGSGWEEVAYATESSYSSNALSLGKHFFTCAVTGSDGAVVLSGIAAVQVNQASLADAVITLDQSAFTYQPIGNNNGFNGFSPSIASVTLYNGSHEVPAEAYTIVASSDTTGKNVGTYTLRITAKDDSSYTGSASVTWKILPCVLTDIELTSPFKVYDGRAITEGNAFDAPAQTFFYGDGNTKYFALGKDSYTITLDSHTFTSADAGSGKVTFTVTLKDGNYTFKDEEGNNTTAKTFTKSVTIGQAELPKEYLPTATLNVVNGVQKTYLLDVSELLKQLPEGCKYGDVIYDADSCNLTGAYENSIATVTNENKLQLNVPQVDSTDVGSVGTVRVKVSTKNYQDFYIVISVNAVNQITPQADGTVSASTIVYGQPLSASTLTGTMKANGETVNGTFTWVDGSAKLNAGEQEAEWRFSPSDDIYAETTGKATITVNKADLANAEAWWITPSDGVGCEVKKAYVPAGLGGVEAGVAYLKVNGITLADANNGKLLDKNLFTVTGDKATEVGTYTLRIEPATGNTNFTGAFEKEWKIVQHTVDWNGEAIDEAVKNYNGNDLLTVSGFKFKSLAWEGYDAIPPSESASPVNKELTNNGYEIVDAHYDSAGVGDEKTIYFTVKLLNDSYTFADGSNTKSFEMSGSSYRIEKAVLSSESVTAREAFTIVNKLSKTYEIDLAQYLPTLPDGCEYGEVTYSDLSIDLRSQYYSGGAPGAPVAEIKDGKVLLPILPNGETTTGKVGTVQVMVSSANYENFLLYIDVNAINKLVPTGAPTLSKDTLIYGEKLGSITLSGAMKDGAAEVEGTFAWTFPETVPDAGTYQAAWRFTPADSAIYDEVTGTVTVTIDKATPTGAPEYTLIAARGKTLADAALAVNESWPDGVVQWVNKDGNALPDDTAVEANTTYKWRFTPADVNNYNTLEGSVKLYSVSTGGGGGSGTVMPPTTTETETTTDPDGTTTKTETKSDGSTVETVTKPDGSTTTTETKTETKPDGSTTTTETKSEANADGSKTETKSETTTAADGSKTETKSETKVEADGTKSETKSETKTDANGVTSGTETTQTTTPDGSTGTTTTTTENGNSKTEAEAKISEKAVEDAKQSGEAVKVPTEVKAGENSDSAPTVKVELPKDAGETKIEIPVSDVNSGTVAVIVHEDGTEEIVKSSTTTENGLQLKVDGSATIKVIDNSKTFIDTENHWSRDEVNFVASRELFNGVGGSSFGVNEPMTRGMVNTVLARLAGVDTTTSGGSKWYEAGTAWAKDNGISDGTNPTANVTREQLAAMLYRFAGSPEVSGELNFADAEHVSGYAKNALLWAVQNGILNGVGDNRVAPKNSAERAQVAAMMARYLKKVG